MSMDGKSPTKKMEAKDTNIVVNEAKTKQEKFKKGTTTSRKDSEKSIKSETQQQQQQQQQQQHQHQHHQQDGSPNKPRPSISSNKENEIKDTLGPINTSPKVPRKFINNWRQACDRTKDRTKELLKKWRTLPEPGQMEQEVSVTSGSEEGGAVSGSGWSEHVWTTWVKRYPSGDEAQGDEAPAPINLTEVQRKKFAHFFIFLLDLDRDDVISMSDFEAFSERLRHFADWSKNSSEYNRLKEVQKGFIECFLVPEDAETPLYSYEALEKKLNKVQLSLDQWLYKWSQILGEARNFQQLPLWLQYFPKVLFQVINRSGSGIITRDELSAFFSSILGLTATQVGAFIDEAYKVLTSNGDHLLKYPVYRLCFANFILASNPNGPGQYLLGPISGIKSACFPIDYKALNAAPEELEQYSPELKTNRRSVIV